MKRTNSHILALDQGTTSSRAIVFDKLGLPVAVAQREFPQIYPKPGWVEHDPMTIWKTQLSTAKRALRLAKLRELRVDGGASANNLLMHFQGDLLNVPVIRPSNTETTASGAAYLAGLATGTWKSKSEIAKQWKIARRFNPSMKPATRKTLVLGWIKALKQATKQYELYFNYIIDMQTIES